MNKINLLMLLVGMSWKIPVFSFSWVGLYDAIVPKHMVAVGGMCRTTSSKAEDKSCLEEFKSRLQIGGNYTHVNIKAHGNSSFDGNLGGAQGLYEYRPRDFFYGAAKLSWKEGNTHGTLGTRSLFYIDTQERVGYSFGLNGGKGLFSLYSGFGYRHYAERVKTKSSGAVNFYYDEFYVPIGFTSDYALNSWVSIGLGFTWMPQIFPSVAATTLKGSRWGLTNELANFFVELPLDFTLTKNKRCHLLFKPFYERWEDGHSYAKSSEGVSFGLPGNTYNFWGVDVNFGYVF